MRFDSVAVLGGAGLVGYQVCRSLLKAKVTGRIAVVSLGRAEVSRAVSELRAEFPAAGVLGRYGNVFGRGTLHDLSAPEAPPVNDRRDPIRRRKLLADIYESFDEAREHSALMALMKDLKPSAVVDCINTATAISYQDVPTAAKQLMADLGLRGTAGHASAEDLEEDLQGLLASIEIPQLVLHVRLLHAALVEARTEVYLKVGTTGTGGMGLNIPYTHGEDKPSPTLMAKTAVAFAHTGLLFLAARTADGPVFKELKPAAMIGYKSVAVHEVPGYVWEKAGDRFVKRHASARPLFEAQRASLDQPLDTRPDASRFPQRRSSGGQARTLRLACVNTGENGWFAEGEFEAITALHQMEMITPEEIAEVTVQELLGRSTGRDVLSALDSSILAPTYRGGLLRQAAIDRLQQIDREGAVPSVALGDLGPPQLSKYLFELYLMRELWPTVAQAVASLQAADAGKRLQAALEERPDLRDAIISVGIPVLLPDGKTFLRGPEVKIPGYDPAVAPRKATAEEIDRYAQKGWVDLRQPSLQRWAERLRRVVDSYRLAASGASEAISRESYGREDFRIGEIVAWIFANEPEFLGYRIK
ncbi:MAG TPA: hypothetical protein VFY93_18370 [Planctomycetota bacterium]|nr:hypothetical protein [Planctomycetota bacterium]